MRIQKLCAIALAPLAASLLFACGSSDDGKGEEPKSLQERLFSGNQADFAEQQRLIRECMVEQGFEYTPMDNRDTGGQRLFDTDSEHFVKEFGYGVSTMFASAIDFRPADDPNQEYRNSLDEAQRKAYDIALYGQDLGGGTFSSSGGVAIGIPIGAAGGDGGDVEITGPGGCMGEALKATGGDRPAFDASLFDDLQDLEERIDSDPKMVEAMKKWSQCMAEDGYEYRDQNEAVKEIREEFGELTGLKLSGDGGGFVVSVSGRVGGDGEPGQAFDPLANVDKEKLTQLQDKEKRLALADYECAVRHVAKVEQQVRERYEDQFIKEHPELGAE